MGLTIVIAALLCVHVSYGKSMWKTCKDVPVTGTLSNVIVNGKTDACILVKGTNANFTLVFKTGESSKSLTSVAHGYVYDMWVPFHLPNPDGCKKSGIVCPLVAKKTYSYHTAIPVLKIYPEMQVIVKWENTGDDKKDILCVMVDCEIRSGEPSKSLTSIAYGYVYGVWIRFVLRNPDGCKNSGIVCPLVAKKTYSYHATVSIAKIYPEMKVGLKWEITGDDKKDILCVMLHCEIRSG